MVEVAFKIELLNVPAGEPKPPVFDVFVFVLALPPKRPPPPELLFWPKPEVVFAPKPGKDGVSILAP